MPYFLFGYVGAAIGRPFPADSEIRGRAMRAPTKEIRIGVWKSGGDGSFGALRLLRTTDKIWGLSRFVCHSERGAPRSESKMNMLAGGKHTAIQR